MLPTIANRVIVYYQTHYKNGQFVSPLPLIGFVTHLFIAAFHLNFGQLGNDIVHLNDFPPSDSYFAPLWPEIAILQGNGIKVLGMLGGAAPGTYDCLTDDLFDTYYPPLRDVIRTYHLDGMDLDVEQTVSPHTIRRIIQTLKSDFGDDFIITLAPTASALTEGGNLSGFDYISLEQDLASSIDWYNAQFYSGFGTFFPEDQYVKIIEFDQGIDPSRVTAVVLTNPDNGSGYIDAHAVEESIGNLMEKYGTGWGGVGGWEYFNSLPEEDSPWMWAAQMSEAMRVQKTRIELVHLSRWELCYLIREGTKEKWQRLVSRRFSTHSGAPISTRYFRLIHE
ncbi:endo-beta-N-acetylglucosaminidase [Dendrothele bispora CBS 962.96]|uniref:Endo-beta-N-acetylglucosaminidase n=1 Tax=Dendrothele bispora (strain CBS 962.96) TaxID=1314807 RepID=A0A4S8LE66_DENBC|nr:endo-beta-N-acetylglucosaminidase [Dendrothele bispora CBS 962.96]